MVKHYKNAQATSFAHVKYSNILQMIYESMSVGGAQRTTSNYKNVVVFFVTEGFPYFTVWGSFSFS